MEGKAWTPSATEHTFDLFPAISFFSQLQTFSIIFEKNTTIRVLRLPHINL